MVCASVRAIVHSLTLVDYLPVPTHKQCPNYRLFFSLFFNCYNEGDSFIFQTICFNALGGPRIGGLNEPQDVNTNKLTCVPSEDSDQPGQI